MIRNMRSKFARRVSPVCSQLALALVLVVLSSNGGQSEEDPECIAYDGADTEITGEDGQWLDNVTNGTNFTELCSGIIDVNSSEAISINDTDTSGSSAPCSNFFKARCGKEDLITLTTDSQISYVDSQSTITATVRPNATEGHTRFYYKLCSRILNSDSDEPEMVECTSNGTTMVSEYSWRSSGEALLTVHVYTNSSFNDSDFLDCDFTVVTVASACGLNLSVDLVNKEWLGDTEFQPYSDEEEDDEYEDENDEQLLSSGNITFISTAAVTIGYPGWFNYYYTYIVRGPSSDKVVDSRLQDHNWTYSANWTWDFLEIGDYNYTVHAIAKSNKFYAHYANVSGTFRLLESVSDTDMQIGSNNSVKVGSRELLTITAGGSTPIKVCWFQTKLQNYATADETSDPRTNDPVPASLPDENPQNRSVLPLRDCILMNDSNSTIFTENRTFDVAGIFQYVANFSNGVSLVRKNFTFHVVAGTSPSVVASSATAVVVLAVMVSLAVLIVALIVGGYIPYRKYKNRMTETADFRFVDLSETGSHWDRVKLKANQFMDYFRRRRHNEKIGLVNLDSIPAPSERRVFYGTNTLTHFAAYETL